MQGLKNKRDQKIDICDLYDDKNERNILIPEIDNKYITFLKVLMEIYVNITNDICYRSIVEFLKDVYIRDNRWLKHI